MRANPAIDNETPVHNSRSPRPDVGAGAAGVGMGTLLALMANNLPSGNPWKTCLVVLAPAVSVAISVVYRWITLALEAFLSRRALQREVYEARNILQESLQSADISQEHKKQLQNVLFELQMILLKFNMEKIRQMTKRPESTSHRSQPWSSVR